jgi:hypothetical protein
MAHIIAQRLKSDHVGIKDKPLRNLAQAARRAEGFLDLVKTSRCDVRSAQRADPTLAEVLADGHEPYRDG